MIDNAINLALEETFRRSETSRLEWFRERWENYYGQGKRPFRSTTGGDDNTRLNFARLIIDKGVAFLFGKEIGFELDETAQTPQEDYLEAAWQANRKMSLLQKLATNGAVCGTAFVKIYYTPGMAYPRVIVLDPETVTITLAEDDIDQVVGYKIQYPSIDPATNKPVEIRQTIDKDGLRWLITDQRGEAQGNYWRTIGEQKWPYAFAPVVHCQNLIAPNEFWGMSDIEDDLIEVIDKENFTVSNTLKILRFHGHPKTWISGITRNQFTAENKMGVDDVTLLSDPNASMHNLEMQSDLASSLNMHRELTQFIHELSRVPEIATGKLGAVGQLSGVALEILYQPLLEKTAAKRVTYGELVVELNRRMLALGGHGDDNWTKLRWQELLPKDAVNLLTAALSKKQLGVSADTLIQEFGYDPDVEREKKLKELNLGAALLDSFDRGGADLNA